jgi:hypothetical protein
LNPGFGTSQIGIVVTEGSHRGIQRFDAENSGLGQRAHLQLAVADESRLVMRIEPSECQRLGQ